MIQNAEFEVVDVQVPSQSAGKRIIMHTTKIHEMRFVGMKHQPEAPEEYNNDQHSWVVDL
jgi:hypothetical protein